MIHSSDEIPVTYLNKGQAYSLAIKDAQGAHLGGAVPTYRTFIRISFEDEQQRSRPTQCWQLWKEGRGMSEAHHRGGRLQAVEFVDPPQTGDMEPVPRPTIELESSSFDGFAVKWSPPPNAPAECSISVRFNFLSTDFSHSKGVKGIPVRLCAKTQMSPATGNFEICYCKVKLFRDHGAERKLANDIAHVKKSIEKLKTQVSQLESGVREPTKKRRVEPAAKPLTSKSGKAQRHKRTWSMSSASDAGGKPTLPPEENLQVKLMALEDMFTSTRPVSMLFLRGEETDDPDLHPIHLTGEPATHELHRSDTGESLSWEQPGTQTSSTTMSPTPSNHSRQSLERTDSGLHRQASFPQSLMGSHEWAAPQFGAREGPARVQRMAQGGMLPEWIEAIGVDGSYRPPPAPVVRPGPVPPATGINRANGAAVACFYVKPRILGEQPPDDYYRAVYVMQRSLAHLVNGVAAKAGLDPALVLRTVRFNGKRLAILVDDETVAELPEGQDMVAEFAGVSPSLEAGLDGAPVEGYELRLLF
jgi:hypothetical protein